MLDQTKRDKDAPHLLCLDESAYADSSDMNYIVHRLTAVANPQMRQNMNVEDEYYSAIEDRDTAIMSRDKKIKEQDGKIKEQREQLHAQTEQLNAQTERLANLKRILKGQGFSDAEIERMMSKKMSNK